MEVRHGLKELYKPILLAMLMAFFVAFFIKPTIVKNYSMSPTLEENDVLVMNVIHNGDPVEKGDIIVFNTYFDDDGIKSTLIKRVIGVSGDEIVIYDGKVYLNKNLIKEEYIKDPYTDGEVELKIPKGKVFVMGDNREISLDSRDSIIGLVDHEDILGKARFRIYPFKKIGLIN